MKPCPQCEELRAMAAAFELVYRNAVRERDAYAENLTATQTRCTELMMQVRELRSIVEEQGKLGGAR